MCLVVKATRLPCFKRASQRTIASSRALRIALCAFGISTMASASPNTKSSLMPSSTSSTVDHLRRSQCDCEGRRCYEHITPSSLACAVDDKHLDLLDLNAGAVITRFDVPKPINALRIHRMPIVWWVPLLYHFHIHCRKHSRDCNCEFDPTNRSSKWRDCENHFQGRLFNLLLFYRPPSQSLAIGNPSP